MEQNKSQRQHMDFARSPQGRLGSYGRLAPSVKHQSHPIAVRISNSTDVPSPASLHPKTASARVEQPIKLGKVMRAKPVAITSVTVPRQNKSTVLKRQSVSKSAVAIHKTTHAKRRLKKEYVLIVTSFILFVSGSGLAVTGLQTRQQQSSVAGVAVEAQDEGLSINGVTTEIEPTSSQYLNHVASDYQPRYIRIPELSVNGRIRNTGNDSTGQLQVPASIFDAGWLRDTASPGTTGVTVIGGHALGATKRGLFFNLQNLKTGNLIEIERGDGTRVRYGVTSVKSFSDMTLTEIKKPTIAGNAELKLFSYPVLPASSSVTAQQGVIVTASQI